jgi:hypothetical protein
MALLGRKRVILAKIETTYGTDATPTGAANAILVRNLDVTPLDAEVVNRDLVRPYLGSMDQLIAAQKVTATFEVELQGTGTAGSAAPFGPLLRACGLAETLNAAPVTGSAQAGTSTSVTLAAAGSSAVDGAYVGLPISITSGTGSGQTGMIVAYNGTTKVATVATPFTTAPAAASGYSIGAGAVYKPVSGSFESVTIYFQPQDNTAANSPLHKLTGVRGNVEFTLNAKQIPVAKFTMMGIYNTVVDSANIAATYTAFKAPLVVNKANTPTFSFFGFAASMTQFNMNMNNQVAYRNLVGAENILITDRKVSGMAVFEAPTIATKDFFTAAFTNGSGNLWLSHGTVAGSIVDFTSGNLDVNNPAFSEADGIVMLSVPYVAIPSTVGNDEVFLTIR